MKEDGVISIVARVYNGIINSFDSDKLTVFQLIEHLDSFWMINHYFILQIWVQVPMRSPKECSDYTECVKDEEEVI